MTIRYTEKNITTVGEPSEFIGLDGSSKLPAIDGSLITNAVASGAGTPRTLTYDSAYGTVVTVNLARNKIYGVSSSGPNFTITSTLRNSYVDGDLIYINNFGNNWFSFVNSDTAGGTKLFVNNTEVTTWRVQQARLIYKVRLTTHTDGNLYVHVTDDLAILEDFADVQDTSNASVGMTLKFNPTTGKWKAKHAWAPKVLVIEDDQVHNYVNSSSDSGTAISFIIDMNPAKTIADGYTRPVGAPEQPAIIGFSDFLLDDDYDHYVIIWRAARAKGYTYQSGAWVFTESKPVSAVTIKLPPMVASKLVGKKLTFMHDAFVETNAPLNIRIEACSFTTELYNTIFNYQYGSGYIIQQFSNMLKSTAPLSGPGYGALTFLGTDNTIMPYLPGSSGGGPGIPGNIYKGWVNMPF